MNDESSYELFRYQNALVVDDFNEMRRTMRKMLESYGVAHADEAINGEQAIRLIENNHYDIIICDFALGEGKNGQQILEEAKHRDLVGYASIFMMVTAEASSSWVMGTMEYQPDDYLVKPFTKEVLKLRLERLLKKKSDLRPIQEAIQDRALNTAIQLCQERIEKRPHNVFEILRIKADLQLRVGDFKGAHQSFQTALNRRQVAWAKLGLGKAYFFLGNLDKAQATFSNLMIENKSYMPAYDWLARVYDKQGKRDLAKEVLQQAIEKSPMSLTRHQHLGALTYKDGDFDAAERSYRAAVKLGQNSYLRKVTDYSSLAKTLAKNGADSEAIKVLQKARHEFDDDDAAIYETVSAEGIVFTQMKRVGEARRAIEEAKELLSAKEFRVDAESSMEFAKTCMSLGAHEVVDKVMGKVIRDQHENREAIEQVRALYQEAGQGDRGARLINSINKEMVDLNNQGVQLVNEGRTAEAVKLFLEAAEGLENNKTINLNAAQVLIRYMRQNGTKVDYLHKVQMLLDRVERLDPQDTRYLSLLRKYGELTK